MASDPAGAWCSANSSTTLRSGSSKKSVVCPEPSLRVTDSTISAKPASVALKARPLAKAKAALPSVQKARKRLA